MSTLMIDAQLGITLQNIPESIFSHISGVPTVDVNGTVIIPVYSNTLYECDQIIQNFLLELGRRYNLNSAGDLRLYSGRNLGTREPIRENAEEDQDSPDPEITEENLEPELDRRESGMFEVNDYELPEPLDSQAAIEAITEVMENNRTNDVAMLAEKTRTFNEGWTRLLNLKREIEETTRAICEDPMISNLIGQVREIKENNDNLVDDIYFHDKHIVFITKNLVTDGEYLGYRRNIGRIECKISLKPLVGSASSEQNPIKIKNLDRRYYGDGRDWECGHVSKDYGICMGTISEDQLFAAMQSRDLHSVVEVIIRFIKNPNQADSWGAHIINWPEYRPEA
jgi:hypothetical protein